MCAVDAPFVSRKAALGGFAAELLRCRSSDGCVRIGAGQRLHQSILATGDQPFQGCLAGRVIGQSLKVATRPAFRMGVGVVTGVRWRRRVNPQSTVKESPGVLDQQHQVQGVGRRRLEVEVGVERASIFMKSVDEHCPNADDFGCLDAACDRVAQ